MLSPKHNSIFVHIPKTAGQSIERFLLKQYGLTWAQKAPFLLRFNPNPHQGPERLAHLTAAEYCLYGYIDQAAFSKAFKFTFVRNPWARLVSEYLFRPQYQHLSFKQFITSGFPPKDNYSDLYRHLLPQYDFIHNNEGKLLVDFIGRFENLDSDFAQVCHQLNIESAPLPHTNVSNNKKPYTDYYDDESIEIVATMYAKDIATFNYQFDY